MTIHREDLLQDRYTGPVPPRMLCPRCLFPSLRLATNEKGAIINNRPNAKTARFAHVQDESILMKLHGAYTAQLMCPNEGCYETVMVVGEWYMYPVDYGGIGPEERYEPRFFYPTVPLFKPPRVPENIGNELDAAFSLYWTDAAACVNRLRCVLELFLSDMGISDRQPNGAHIPLNNRINALPAHSLDFHSHMHAIRWLGNEGSHPAGSITREAAVDAMQLIEYMLGKRFSTADLEAAQIAATINAQNPHFQPRS